MKKDKTIIGLKDETINKIRNNQKLKGKLIVLFEVTESTLNRWLNENNIKLLNQNCLRLIEIELNEQLSNIVKF